MSDDGTLDVSIDHDMCIGAGQCALTAPGVFTQDDDGFGTVLPGSARRWPIGTDLRIGDQARFQQLRSGNDGAAPPPPRAR